MMIDRYFTKNFKPLKDLPDQYFNWKSVDVEIKNPKTGETVYEQKNCEFPEHFSQTACNIIASKYFFRAVEERSFLSLVDRMVKFWKDNLIDSGILTPEEAKIFYDEACFTLYSQMWSPNSPQWFNTGIFKQYGIKGDSDEMYYYNPKTQTVDKSKDRYTRSQASACFILDIKDQLIGKGSITDHYVTETKLFKGGSGTGTNFSPLRADGEHLSSGGTSSGLMSYLKGLDVNAGTIKSGGTTRRAAKMVIVDIDHPEVENFIDWKVKEEKKAKALGEAGYDMSIGGEAYSTVSGQNSNNSVRLNEKFMSAVANNEDWELKGRKDECVNKTVKAKDLYHKIAAAAWECGDPGVQFDDIYNEWNTCKESGRINATNPCSEFAFLDNSACNLASINLEKFLIRDGKDITFNIKAYEQIIRIAQLAMEASIHGGQYPTEEIAYNSYKYRPTGLGISNLAYFLNEMGYAYDDPKARAWASLLTSYLTAASYDVSGEMAKRIGAFDEFPKNKRSMKCVLYEHVRSTFDIEDYDDQKINGFKEIVLDKWKSAITHPDYRNAQVSAIAPTGTISLIMDCETTGIEPYYSRVTTKTLSDGSVITSENKNVIKTAEEIDPKDHVKMIAAIQPFISGGISKTVNLPNEATIKEIEDIFTLAYLTGCKSITVYRDGSKGTQVLTKKEEKEKPAKEILTEWLKGVTDHETVQKKEMMRNQQKRKKPNSIRPSRTHAAKIGDIELYITVGYYDDGSIAELFISNDKEGTLVRGLLASLSKSISHQFQNGEKPEEISKMLRGQKYEPCGVVERHPNIKMADSISDLVSKVIDIELGDYSRCQVKPANEAENKEYKKLQKEIIQKNLDVLTDSKMDDYNGDNIPYWKQWKDKKKNEDTDNQIEPNDDFTRVYGEVCSFCGSDLLMKSGNCKVCFNCGETTGCS